MQKENFREIFNRARMASRKTFRKISEASGLTIGELSDIGRGDKFPPDIETVRVIETFLGIDNGELVRAATEEFEIQKGKVLNPHEYLMAVTKTHLHLIAAATDLYCFLLLGKIEHPLWQLYTSRDIDHDDFAEACGKLKQIVFPELDRNSWYGVGWKPGDNSQNNSQIAYEIQAMIRHELWKRQPNPDKSVVSSDQPLHYSPEALIKIEDIKKEISEENL